MMSSKHTGEDSIDGSVSFDPYSKCIRFPKAAALQGVIVDMSPAAEAFIAKMIESNTIITGEIIDIVDKNDAENMESNTNDDLPSPKEYKQKMRLLQSKHAYQTQQLIHQHSATRNDIENNDAVERKHYLELMRLMQRQQEEQTAEFENIIANQQQKQLLREEKSSDEKITSTATDHATPSQSDVNNEQKIQIDQQRLIEAANLILATMGENFQSIDAAALRSSLTAAAEQYDDGGYKEEEEEGIVESSYRSGKSIKSAGEGTKDSSLPSARSSKSVRGGKFDRDNSDRSGKSLQSNISETDDGTRDESLRSRRSRQSNKSARSEDDEGTRGSSLKSDGKSGQSRKSNFDVSNRSGQSMKSIRSSADGTRDSSLKSGRSSKNRKSDIDLSNRSGQSTKSNRSGTDELRESWRSNESGVSDASSIDDCIQSDQSGSADSREGSVKSHSSSRSGRSGGSIESDQSENNGRKANSLNRSARSRTRTDSPEERGGKASHKNKSSQIPVEEKESVVVKDVPKVVEQKPGTVSSTGGAQRRMKLRRKASTEEMDEIKEVMKDRSLSRRERLTKVKEIKEKYIAADEEREKREVQPLVEKAPVNDEEENDAVMEEAGVDEETDDVSTEKVDLDEDAHEVVSIEEEEAAETQEVADDHEEGNIFETDVEIERQQSKEEKAKIKLVKKDKSLSKKEKKKMIKQIKAEYDSLEKQRLSAAETVEHAPISKDQVPGQATQNEVEQREDDQEVMREPTKEEKAEIKKILKDNALSKKEKKKKMKKVKAKYDAMWKERIAAEKATQTQAINTDEVVKAAAQDHSYDNIEGEEQVQDDYAEEDNREPSKEEQEEKKKVMKDKTLSKKEKKKKLKRIKAKYDKLNNNDTRDDVEEVAAVEASVGLQYVPISSKRKGDEQHKIQGRHTSPPPSEEGEWQPAKINPLQRNSSTDVAVASKKDTEWQPATIIPRSQNSFNDQLQLSTSPPPSNNTGSNNVSKDVMAPLEDKELQTDRTPMKKLVKMMENNDPLLDVIKLDGRKKIKEDDWEAFFTSLEDNNSLTHLSISRCDLTDEIALNLVLALVENVSLVALKLTSNKGITDETAKGFIKVLNQSNKTLKKLDLSKTKVSKKALDKISGIMDKRDDQKKIAKLQDLRSSKILDLLSYSAGDNIAAERKMSETNEDSDDDGIEESVHSGKSGKSGISGRSGTSGRRQGVGGMRASKAGGFRASQIGGRGGGAALRSSTSALRASSTAMRASMTARNMAQLGGDSIGADSNKIREQRRMKGECEDCGQRCFLKSMFKSTPLTIPNVVFEGRCLKCNPM